MDFSLDDALEGLPADARGGRGGGRADGYDEGFEDAQSEFDEDELVG